MTKNQETNTDDDNTEAAGQTEADANLDTENAKSDQASEVTANAEDCAPEDLAVEVERLQKALAEAEAKAEENWEHFVRTKADLDNLERRSQRDIENAHKYAGDKFLEAIIPVIDSLEMGAQAALQESADIAKLREGMELTLKMFADTLSKFEVKKLDPVGDSFNPDFHQAMSIQESDKPANTVLSVMQKGYLLNERLIRPALVVVSKPGKKSAATDAGAEKADNDSSKNDDAPEESLGNTIDEKA